MFVLSLPEPGKPGLSPRSASRVQARPPFLARLPPAHCWIYPGSVLTALFASLFISGLPLPPSVVYWTTTYAPTFTSVFINSPLANRIIKGPPLKITFKGFVFSLLCAIPDAAAGVTATWLINHSLKHPLWALCLIIPPILYLIGPQLILWNLKTNLWPGPEQDA